MRSKQASSKILNDIIGRNSLLGNRKKIAKFFMRTFTCRSTFLYAAKAQLIVERRKDTRGVWYTVYGKTKKGDQKREKHLRVRGYGERERELYSCSFFYVYLVQLVFCGGNLHRNHPRGSGIKPWGGRGERIG
jgi:hypothetical protein